MSFQSLDPVMAFRTRAHRNSIPVFSADTRSSRIIGAIVNFSRGLANQACEYLVDGREITIVVEVLGFDV